MGRFVDLCAAVAAVADEGAEGLVLAREDWERLEDDFSTDEIEDALSIVRESESQQELVEAADVLSSRLVELLGAFGSVEGFARARAEGGRLSIEALAHLVRAVARLEEVLAGLRDDAPPDRRGFDALQRRLMDLNIEDEMRAEPLPQEQDEEDD